MVGERRNGGPKQGRDAYYSCDKDDFVRSSDRPLADHKNESGRNVRDGQEEYSSSGEDGQTFHANSICRSPKHQVTDGRVRKDQSERGKVEQ
jgi:hypothetical protein